MTDEKRDIAVELLDQTFPVQGMSWSEMNIKTYLFLDMVGKFNFGERTELHGLTQVERNRLSVTYKVETDDLITMELIASVEGTFLPVIEIPTRKLES